MFRFMGLLFSWLLCLALDVCSADEVRIAKLSATSVSLQVGEKSTLGFSLDSPLDQDLTLQFIYYNAAGEPLTSEKINETAIGPLGPIVVKANETGTINITVKAIRPGLVSLGLNTTDAHVVIKNLHELLCRVAAMHYKWLDVFQIIIGWTYFAAWTVSFYPQVILNWKRKSVIGLNFDFVILNIVGFLAYSTFNIGLFWIKPIQALYKERHPFGAIPVLTNDVFFALHALAISLFIGVQVLCFKRGNQRVSKICIGILILIGLYCITICSIAGANAFSWLDFLYYLSYVKLFITFIKYMPQAIMNCRRRSTIGWSIMNIILDLTGGILSMLQMFIIAYNFDDWGSITGSPIKFGLGIFSVGFDIFFMIQHWVLYPNHEENLDSRIIDINSTYIFGQPRETVNQHDPGDTESLVHTEQGNTGHENQSQSIS